MLITHIFWNPDEALMDLGFFAVRYYSLFFMLAFASSYWVTKRQFDVKMTFPNAFTTTQFLLPWRVCI